MLRHIKDFASRIFDMDASGMMLAFEDMMRRKIVMPAHLLRESGQKAGELWEHFSDAAQRAMVYTAQDYINIFKDLIDEWKIDSLKNLNDKAERARDYVMKLPDRLQKISDRIATPHLPYSFKWVKS